MRQFKYRQTFATKNIKLIFPADKSMAVALASLESLKQLLPAHLNIKENPDLLFNSFNAAVVNLVNANDDGIQTETALNLYKRFLNKFCDLEHERTSIVGFIINSGLSEFISNRIITEEEARSLNTPFNISLGSVVWPVVDPGFADLLVDSSDETSPHYQEISASWEIGFDDIHLAIGSKDLSEAEIIKDEKQINELKQYLRSNEGSGTTNQNEPIYRVIIGDAIPLGIGYTMSPAASVKGVIVTEPDKMQDIEIPNKESLEEEKQPETIIINNIADMNIDTNTTNITEIVDVTPSKVDEKGKSEKIISQAEKHTVNNSSMKLTSIEDLTDDSLKEFSSATIRNFLGKQISEKIDEVSTEYAEKLEARENELKQKKEAAEAIEKQFEETKKQMDEIAAELAAEKEARAQEKVQTDFNVRMADLDSKYDLNDGEREVLAKNIRGLDDEQYAAKAQEFEVLLAAKKKKAYDAEDDPKKGGDNGADEDTEDKMDKKKKAKASIENVLDETKEDNKVTPPNTPSIEKSLYDEFADAFKLEDFKVNIRK